MVQVLRVSVILMLMSPLLSASPLQPGTVSIDTQEWRDQPQRHLFIHGTLNGDTDFRIFLPERDAFKHRMLQYLQGGLGGDEKVGTLLQHDAFALAHGAVYVESNQGHRGTATYEEDDSWREIAYEASYSVVQYAQTRAVELYAQPCEFVYVTGDSGGGHRATGLIERFPELYDGAVPCVAAGTFQVPWYLFSVLEQSRPLLQEKNKEFEEAFRPGGPRDPWAIISNEEEKRALRRLLFAGHPMEMLGALRAEATALLILDYAKYNIDPTFFEDFWNKPGYAGREGSVADQLVEKLEGTVTAVDSEKSKITAEFTSTPPPVAGMTLTFTSGKLAGQWRRVYGQQQGQLQIGFVGPGIEGAAAGDTFVFDNRDLIAFKHLHYHLRDPEDPIFAGLPEDGNPSWTLRDPEMAAGIYEPDRPVGELKGKVIAIYSSRDTLVWPSNAFRYAAQVRKALGDATDDHFRLHFVENGVHNPLGQRQDAAKFVGRVPLVHKALEELMAWAEEGVAAAPGTAYTSDDMHQLHLAKTAQERGGYQPVLTIAAADQHAGAETAANEEMTIQVSAEDPDNELVLCEIDYEGDGTYDDKQPLTGRSAEARFVHAYTAPGTYYPTARVTDSTRDASGEGIQNLAAMYVVVKGDQS